MRFDALPTNGEPAAIVGKNEGPGNQNKWIFGYAIRHVGVANATVFHINSPSTGPVSVHSNPWTPAIGQWHHLAVVERKPGTVLAQRRGGRHGLNRRRGPARKLRHVDGPIPKSWSLGCKADLDDVRIWNTALTGDQIHAQMNAELSGVEEGLAGYWTMDGGFGATVLDPTLHHASGVYKGRVGTVSSPLPR